MQTRSIRVAVADDNDMIRYGMSVFMETFADLMLVGEARNGIEAIELCRTAKPDVVLMDLIMPEMNGVAAIRRIRQEMPHIRCVALTSFDDAELVHDALQAGAISYLIKNMSLDELAAAIHDAYMGKSTFSQEAVQALRDETQPMMPVREPVNGHELEILQHLSQGLTDDEIAGKMSLTPAMLDYDIQLIIAKLNSQTRAEAMAIAMRDRLIATNF